MQFAASKATQSDQNTTLSHPTNQARGRERNHERAAALLLLFFFPSMGHSVQASEPPKQSKKPDLTSFDEIQAYYGSFVACSGENEARVAISRQAR
jgi:hypothetical protein